MSSKNLFDKLFHIDKHHKIEGTQFLEIKLIPKYFI